MNRAWMAGGLGISVLFGLAITLVACGGGGNSPGNLSAGGGNAFVFFGDAPPPGTTILKFEITLTGAVLCPQVTSGACEGTPQVSLLNQPVEIELKQLELESAFLGLVSVPPGTYAGVKLTFANPELKILRADGTVAELQAPALPLNPAMVTPTFAGGLSVAADTNFGFLIDFNIFDSIQSDSLGNITGISPMVTLVKLPALAQQEIEELEDVTGKISNLNKTCPTGSFTLIESMTGLPIANIRFDGTTELEDGLTCEALANDQIIEADLELRATASLQSAEWFAEEIELVNPPQEDELEGLVFQVNSPSAFVLFVQEEEDVPNVPIGSFVTVTLDPGVQFRIDADDLPIPSPFASGNDLLAGQTVEVDVKNGSLTVPAGTTCAAIADNCTATAEKIKLKKGSLTARVDTVTGPNFTLKQLPSLFGTSTMPRPLSADCQACFISSVLVSTSSQTEFRDVANVTGLNADDLVTVRGLLFKNGFSGPNPGTGSPQLVARRVRRRTP